MYETFYRKHATAEGAQDVMMLLTAGPENPIRLLTSRNGPVNRGTISPLRYTPDKVETRN